MLYTRIAPTPSGYIHTGNIFSFYLTSKIAQKFGGKLLLRIDDLDTDRSRLEFIADIFDSLEFFGIEYQDGPIHPKEFYSSYSQKHRENLYEELLLQLIEKELIYACTCSRKHYSYATKTKSRCECLDNKLPLDTPGACWRIFVPDNTFIHFHDDFAGDIEVDLSKQMGDFVVRRKEGMAAYQVSSLADDLFFGVNYIVRGTDLLHSTAAQLYLANVSGSQEFLDTRFLHHPLIEDDEGKKLSKSAGSTAIKSMRQEGIPAGYIISGFNESVAQIIQRATFQI